MDGAKSTMVPANLYLKKSESSIFFMACFWSAQTGRKIVFVGFQNVQLHVC